MNLEFTTTLVCQSWAWVWANTFAATVLIILVAVVQRVIGKRLPASWQYALWLLVLARLAWPAAPASKLSVHNFVTLPPVAPAMPSFPHATRQEGVGVLAPAIFNPATAAPRPENSSKSKFATHQWSTIVAWIWAAGAFFGCAVIGVQHFKMALWIRRQQAVSDPGLLELLEQAKAALNQRGYIPLIAASEISVPAVFGVWRPRLLLPPGLAQHLDAAELRHVLLHELVHVRHRDVLLNWLLIFAQACHWFNPVVWLALRRLRANRELYCDAVVLSLLKPGERHAYGGALLKIAAGLSRPKLIPTLAPILNHKPQIHQRIVMITQFKPTPRMLNLGAGVLVLALTVVTFTRAAEDTNKPIETAKPPPQASAKSEMSPRQRIEVMSRELDRYQKRTEDLQQRLTMLKDQMGLLDEQAGQTIAADQFRHLGAAIADAKAQFNGLNKLYRALTNLNRAELLRSIATAAPDPLLQSLQNQKAAQEQQLAELSLKLTTKNPQIIQIKQVLATIQKQIEDRLEGIMTGIKVRVDSEKERLESLQKELPEQRQHTFEQAAQRFQVEDLQRELGVLQKFTEELHTRLLREKLEAVLADDVERR